MNDSLDRYVSVAACFAHLSAFSFPNTAVWPRTHWMLTLVFGLLLRMVCRLLTILRERCCPGVGWVLCIIVWLPGCRQRSSWYWGWDSPLPSLWQILLPVGFQIALCHKLQHVFQGSKKPQNGGIGHEFQPDQNH